MKIALTLVAFVVLSIESNAQHMLVTMKDSTASEISVRSYGTRSLTTMQGELIEFWELARVILLDFNQDRDSKLLTALQTSKVRVLMGSEKDKISNQSKLKDVRTQSDSLRIAILETRVLNMSTNIEYYRGQATTGIWLEITGASIAVVSGLVGSVEGAYAGLGIALMGTGVRLNAYKHLRRATVLK